jgi:hypothetical protein
LAYAGGVSGSLVRLAVLGVTAVAATCLGACESSFDDFSVHPSAWSKSR